MEGNGFDLGTLNTIIVALIPILSPILTDLIKKMASGIPPNYLPIISTVIGALTNVLVSGFSGETLAVGAGAGAAGVGIREAWNQNVTKKLEGRGGGGS